MLKVDSKVNVASAAAIASKKISIIPVTTSITTEARGCVIASFKTLNVVSKSVEVWLVKLASLFILNVASDAVKL
jgi:hypothetical protein